MPNSNTDQRQRRNNKGSSAAAADDDSDSDDACAPSGSASAFGGLSLDASSASRTKEKSDSAVFDDLKNASAKLAAAAANAAKIPERVVVHPLVLLSVVDHYTRVAAGHSNRRVLGVLLGQKLRGPGGKISYNVANSFAVPFEEDENDARVWFLDHNYVESMISMFRKVNAREVMVGWYHTGPSLRASDLEINALFKRLDTRDIDPVLVVVDVDKSHVGIPADSFFAIDEVKDDGTPTTRTFMHVPSAVEAEEAEEIGVEHLLRDIKGSFIGSLSSRLHERMLSLRGLSTRLTEIRAYLAQVAAGTLPLNHKILNNLQHAFNLLPHLDAPALSRSFIVQNNDKWMVMYLASLMRAVLALHNLIDNKLANKELEEQHRQQHTTAKPQLTAAQKSSNTDGSGTSAPAASSSQPPSSQPPGPSEGSGAKPPPSPRGKK